VLQRVVSWLVVASLAAAPTVARTRLVCRYTGVEITDCDEQQAPGAPEVRKQECCDKQMTPAPSAMRKAPPQEIQPPAALALAPLVAVEDVLPSLLNERAEPRPSSGSPVYLITRALLI
jgi:hypothetical protein